MTRVVAAISPGYTGRGRGAPECERDCRGEGGEASAAQAIAVHARACEAKHEAACGEERRLRAATPPR
jgi:hypothetical protein